MVRQLHTLLALGAALLLVCLFAASHAQEATISGPEVDASKERRLSPLLDFEHYKQVFHKRYSSLAEELLRRSYFVPRALQVICSAVAYMFRKKSYHLALNHMSDMTVHELEAMDNQKLASAFAPPPEQPLDSKLGAKRKRGPDDVEEEQLSQDEEHKAAPPAEEPIVLMDDEQLAAGLEEVAREVPLASSFLLARDKEGRRKRSPMAQDSVQDRVQDSEQEGAGGAPRRIALADLMSTGAQEMQYARTLKVFDSVPSNNPQYEPLELFSQGIGEQIRPVETRMLQSVYNVENQRLIMAVKKSLRTVITRRGDNFGAPKLVAEEADGVDEIMVDHSRGGCLDLPRSQGNCGSCWAFAGIAMYEWLYCKKHGKLVRFSEQYMVDCGTHVKAFGCAGGIPDHAAHFVRNFGLELRKNYPYKAQDQTCPFDNETTNLKTTGYVRFDSENVGYVHQSLWEEMVHFGPIFIMIRTTDSDFKQYGRGIHRMKACPSPVRPTHAVVLVGYGRQDGVKYWKIRNSYSVGWGEGGYYRLAQSSSSCLEYYGLMFATKDGYNFDFNTLKTNTKYDRDVIKNFYWGRPAKKQPKVERMADAEDQEQEEDDEQEAGSWGLSTLISYFTGGF